MFTEQRLKNLSWDFKQETDVVKKKRKKNLFRRYPTENELKRGINLKRNNKDRETY